MPTLIAESREELGRILDHIHDRRFALGKIDFDAARQTLRIPIEVQIKRRRKLLGFELPMRGTGIAILVIQGVKQWRIVEDKAEIGYGDVNRILRTSSGLLIEGSLPVSIEVDSDTFHIELEAPQDITLA